MNVLGRLIILLSIFFFNTVPAKSQNLFQVELSEAFVFYDLIREPNDNANAYKGTEPIPVWIFGCLKK